MKILYWNKHSDLDYNMTGKDPAFYWLKRFNLPKREYLGVGGKPRAGRFCKSYSANPILQMYAVAFDAWLCRHIKEFHIHNQYGPYVIKSFHVYWGTDFIVRPPLWLAHRAPMSRCVLCFMVKFEVADETGLHTYMDCLPTVLEECEYEKY